MEGLEQGIQELVAFGQTVVFCHLEIPTLDVRHSRGPAYSEVKIVL